MAYKQNDQWRLTWMKDGNRKTRLLPKGTSAAKARKLEQEIKLGLLFPNRSPSTYPTFAEWCQVWVRDYSEVHKTYSSQVKDKGIIKYHLDPVLGHLRLNEIVPSHVIDLQTKLVEKEFAPQSINNIVALASTIMRYAVMLKLIDTNPCTSVKRVRKQDRAPTFWTFEETDRFLSHCREHDWDLFQLCAFAVTTGLRPGELQGLLRDCLDFERGYVVVRRNWCTKANKLNEYTKGKRDRKVSVPRAILDVLADKRGIAPTDHVFPFIFNSLGWRRIRPLAVEAGVKPIRFHDLRHTFASHLVMRGRHVVEIQEMLGHTKLETTMKYMHLAEDRNRGVTDCLVTEAAWLKPKTDNVVNLCR